MRLKQFYAPILLEMNVANLDQIKKDISDIFDVESGARHQPVPKATRDLFCIPAIAPTAPRTTTRWNSTRWARTSSTSSEKD